MTMSDEPSKQPRDREPDELDALLQRTEPSQQGGATTNDNNAQQYNALLLPSGLPPPHRKSYSVGVGSAMHGGIIGVDGRRRRLPRHRKNKSSISELMSGAFASGDLQPIREDLQESAANVRKEFVHGLDQMDRGETSGNFDMSLTRSLSVLPDNLQELAYEAGVQDPDELDEQGSSNKKKDGGAPIVQYLMLFSAVAAISSNSTALHMLDGVAAPMKLFWRMTASYIVLSPMALYYLMKDGVPQLSLGGWMTFISAILCFSAQNLLFYSSLQLTTIGNAVIYSNSQALLLIVGKAFVGAPIHIFEACGVVVAFAGAILCSKDSESSSLAEDHSNAIYGDLLALMGAVVGVAYLTFAKAIRSEMSVTVFIFYVMFFGSFAVLAFIAADSEEGLQWTMDPHDGVFGGFSIYHGRVLVLIHLAVVCNMVGTMGFVRAMATFDTVVIAVATLMEPLMASLIAFIFHAGLLPGPLGWFGNFLVVAGTLAVVYPSMGKGGGGGDSAMH